MTHRPRLHTLRGGPTTHTSGFARIQRHGAVKRTSDMTVRPVSGQRSLQDRRSANARYQASHTMTRYRHDAHFGNESAAASEYLQGEEPYMRNERLRDSTRSRIQEQESTSQPRSTPQQAPTACPRFAPNIRPGFVEPPSRKFDPFS